MIEYFLVLNKKLMSIFKTLSNAIKSYETLITEALNAKQEEDLKKHIEGAMKSQKSQVSLVLCNLIDHYDYVKGKAMSDDIKKTEAEIALVLKYGSGCLNTHVMFGYGGGKPTTPLLLAVKNLDADMVQLLLNNGADAKLLFPADNPVNSALHEACKCYSGKKKEQRMKIINLLLEKGADVNSVITFEEKFMSGDIYLRYRTPLMGALCSGKPLDNDVVEIFRTLLKREEYDLSVKGERYHKPLKEILASEPKSDFLGEIMKLITEVETRPKKAKADGRSRARSKERAKKNGRSKSPAKKNGRSKSHAKKNGSSSKRYK